MGRVCHTNIGTTSGVIGAVMPPELRALARAAKGFMPDPEGELLFRLALDRLPHGPALEVGGYCGKSAVYLGAAARMAGGTLFSVDHHRGSEENQEGWPYHDPTLADPEFDGLDTLPAFRHTIAEARLEEHVVAVVGRSRTVSAHWRTPLSLLFVDGGHTDEHVTGDYEGFGRWVAAGATLAFHDIYPDPADGGQAPYRVYRRAVDGGDFAEVDALGSMRVLTRVHGDAGDPLA